MWSWNCTGSSVFNGSFLIRPLTVRCWCRWANIYNNLFYRYKLQKNTIPTLTVKQVTLPITRYTDSQRLKCDAFWFNGSVEKSPGPADSLDYNASTALLIYSERSACGSVNKELWCYFFRIFLTFCENVSYLDWFTYRVTYFQNIL